MQPLISKEQASKAFLWLARFAQGKSTDAVQARVLISVMRDMHASLEDREAMAVLDSFDAETAVRM
jgi:hypothetical protein